MKRMIKHISLLTALVAMFALLSVAAYADVPDPFDKSLVFAPETQLTVYVDNQWSSALSGTYGFGDKTTITAPETSESKTFSHWTADGSIISYGRTLNLTMNAHTTLYAVYASAAPTAKPVAGFTSITRTNDSESISFQAIAYPNGGTIAEAGIVYSTTATGNNLKIGSTGVTQVAAVKYNALPAGGGDTPLPASILDKNNCWMLQMTPASADTVYHARTYMTIGTETTYGDVKDVKLSGLQSGIWMVANLEGFEPGINDTLAGLTGNIHTITFDPNGGVGAEIVQVFKDSPVTLRANSFTRDDYIFTGWNTKQDGTGASYADKDSVTLNANATLYAQWVPGKCAVTFKVVNGAWDNGSTDDLTVIVTGISREMMKLATDQIPAVGTKPNEGYKAGAWDKTPNEDAAITEDTTYTYTYFDKDSISKTVTFKVVNGTWNDGTAADKTVTLNGKEGDTLKLAGNQIPAVGTKPNEGYKAGAWDVTPNTNAAITQDTTYTYTYIKQDAVTYTVTFNANGGKVTPSSAVTAADGKLSNLPTPTRTGSYSFIGWYDAASGGTRVTTNTVFIKDTTIYAHWNYTGGGGGGNSGTPATTTVTVPVSGEDASVNVTVFVRGDTATIGSANVDKVLNAEDVGTVTIDVNTLQQNVTEVIIPGTMMEKIADAVASEASDANGLEVKLPSGSVTFDSEAVAAIAEQAGGKDLAVNLDGVKVTDLVSAQQEAVKELEVEVVLDAYLTVGGQRISDFKGGSATVKIPYTLKDGQTAQGLVVWYVANEGTKTQVPATYDGKNVVFTVPHFSNYVIAYDAEKATVCPQDDTCPISAFTDADPKAWYHDGIHYALDEGIMNGTGGGKFEPNKATTRAMIVTMLWRLEGEPAVNYAMTFADVPDGQWYTEAVRWAASSGIVSGYSDAAFGPNDSITREQLATILYRYAQSKGEGFKGSWMFLLDFPDAGDVSEWADEAMHWMVMNELIQGMDGLLNPRGEATRAQIATILMRYDAMT